MFSVTRPRLIAFLALLLAVAYLAQPGSAQQPAGRQGGAGAAGGRQGGAPNFDNVQIETLHVQGNVYMATSGQFNAAFSVGDDGVLVVDTLLEPLADKFL